MLYGESAPLPAARGRRPKIVRGFVRVRSRGVVEMHPLTTRDCLATRNRSEP